MARGRTVLIVDDIPYVRTTLSGILSKAHYRITGEASTGLQAVELYKKLRPDLVTMDVVMPEMSGVEATRKIIREFPEARVIMVSAIGHETFVMEAIGVGARDYILKPFLPDDVVKTVENVMTGDLRLTQRIINRR